MASRKLTKVVKVEKDWDVWTGPRSGRMTAVYVCKLTCGHVKRVSSSGRGAPPDAVLCKVCQQNEVA